MLLPVIRYPLDKTGTDPDNYVNDEPHILADLRIRAIAPTYGAFYTDSLNIYDEANDRLLVRGIQYTCSEMLQEPTKLYAKEICYLILIIDPTVSSDVRISYQTLGGPYTKSADAVVSLYELVQDTPKRFTWANVTEKPSSYQPSPHLHDLSDVVNFQHMVSSLERLKNAIELSNAPMRREILVWVQEQIESFTRTFLIQLDNSKGVVNIDNLPLASITENGITTNTDKIIINNYSKAFSNNTKQYVNSTVISTLYINTLNYLATCNGVLIVVASFQPKIRMPLAALMQLKLNGKRIDSDDTPVTMTNFHSVNIIKGTSYSIQQEVTFRSSGQNASFGLMYLFIPGQAVVTDTSSLPPETTPAPTPQPTASPTPAPIPAAVWFIQPGNSLNSEGTDYVPYKGGDRLTFYITSNLLGSTETAPVRLWFKLRPIAVSGAPIGNLFNAALDTVGGVSSGSFIQTTDNQLITTDIIFVDRSFERKFEIFLTRFEVSSDQVDPAVVLSTSEYISLTTLTPTEPPVPSPSVTLKVNSVEVTNPSNTFTPPMDQISWAGYYSNGTIKFNMNILFSGPVEGHVFPYYWVVSQESSDMPLISGIINSMPLDGTINVSGTYSANRHFSVSQVSDNASIHFFNEGAAGMYNFQGIPVNPNTPVINFSGISIQFGTA